MATYVTLTETEWEKVNRVWALLDEGKVERARIELDALMGARPGHPDLRIVDAAIALDEAEPRRALQALEGAERSADPALFFHLRAVALYETAQFERAREDAGRAIAVHPDLAEAHDLLSRASDHLGDHAMAVEHATEAREIDPDAFPPPLEVTAEAFDALVARCVEELPPEIRRHLDDVPVLVQDLPDRDVLTAEEPPLSPDLLGLHVGPDLMRRSHLDAPSVHVIFLFRRNLLRTCADLEELEREVRVTVLHEVGHMVGLDEDDLDRWGLA
jgi:predicted Zn-dependent protease with MMP-like domain